MKGFFLKIVVSAWGGGAWMEFLREVWREIWRRGSFDAESNRFWWMRMGPLWWSRKLAVSAWAILYELVQKE